jgi:hypothetical protein
MAKPISASVLALLISVSLLGITTPFLSQTPKRAAIPAGSLVETAHYQALPEHLRITQIKTGIAKDILSHWTGYVGVPPASAPVPWDVGEQFTLPSLDCPASKNLYSAVWVGYDGFTNNTNLAQAGLNMNCIGGKAQYGFWWEILPASQVPISYPLQAGDTVTVYVDVANQSLPGQVEFTGSVSSPSLPLTTVFDITKKYTGSGRSVECIYERPKLHGRLKMLAQPSGSITMDCGSQLSNTQFLTFSSPPSGWKITNVTMENSKKQVLAQTSASTPNIGIGNTFNYIWSRSS